MPQAPSSRLQSLALTFLVTVLLLAGAAFRETPRSFQLLVLAAMVWAYWSAGSRLARWLVPDFTPASRWTAAFSFATALSGVPATWMGHFGWMRPGPFLVWTAVAYVASRFLPQPPLELTEEAPEPAMTGLWSQLRRIETVLLLSALLAVAYIGLQDMHRLRYAPAGPYGFDDNSYHLSAVAVWLRHGDLRMIRFSMGDASTAFYPVLSEVASWVLFVPFGDSDVAARWTQLPYGVFSFFAVAGLALRLGLSRWNAVFAALLFASLHRVWPVFALSAGNDHSTSFYTLAALDAGLALARRPRWGTAATAGTALGLLLATKYIGVLFAPVVLAVVAVAALVERRGWEVPRPSARALTGLALLLAATMAVTGGYTYLRNAVTMGNPIFPAPVSLPGIELPGWESATVTHRDEAPEFDIDIPYFLTQRKELFGPFFPVTMLPAALLAPLVALARRRWTAALLFSLPTVFFLQFLYLMHDHRDMRYFLPGVALAALAFAWLAAQAGRWAIPARALLLALITYQATRRLGMEDAREILLTLELLAAGALAYFAAVRWQGRVSWEKVRRWGPPAAAALVAVACLSLGPKVEKYQRVKLDLQWGPLALERIVGDKGARVAYAGLNRPYLFFGSRLQNDLQIVPRTRHADSQYYTWGGPAEDSYGGGVYRRWRRLLERKGVEYVVIILTGSEDPERHWMQKRPQEFERVYEDQETEIWKVLPGGGGYNARHAERPPRRR